MSVGSWKRRWLSLILNFNNNFNQNYNKKSFYIKTATKLIPLMEDTFP